ncbi:MAG: Hpt domain-containing protein [Polyangiaceae bacterium]
MAETMSPQEEARQAAIRAALAELQAEYAEGLPALVADLSAAVDAACGSCAQPEVRHLLTLVHRMHGAAGSYGFKGVSAAAGELEVFMTAHEQSKKPFDEAAVAQVRTSLAKVKEVAERELAELAPSTSAGDEAV